MADDIILDVKNLNTSFFVDGKEVHIIKNVSLQAKPIQISKFFLPLSRPKSKINCFFV